MSFLDQLRQTTPEVKTTAEAPPAPGSDRPPLSLSDPLPTYPLCVWSRILSEEIWITPDGWTGELPGPAYTHAEVAVLDRQRPTPEALRQLHQVKTHFDGEVLP